MSLFGFGSGSDTPDDAAAPDQDEAPPLITFDLREGGFVDVDPYAVDAVVARGDGTVLLQVGLCSFDLVDTREEVLAKLTKALRG